MGQLTCEIFLHFYNRFQVCYFLFTVKFLVTYSFWVSKNIAIYNLFPLDSALIYSNEQTIVRVHWCILMCFNLRYDSDTYRPFQIDDTPMDLRTEKVPFHGPQFCIKLPIVGTGGNSLIKGMEMFIIPLKGANDGVRSHLLRSEKSPNIFVRRGLM